MVTFMFDAADQHGLSKPVHFHVDFEGLADFRETGIRGDKQTRAQFFACRKRGEDAARRCICFNDTYAGQQRHVFLLCNAFEQRTADQVIGHQHAQRPLAMTFGIE